MNPFPLSIGDYQAFVSEVGIDTIYALPQWGGIFNWHGRYILAYVKPAGDFALTDITGGIPDSSVPGGMIPVDSLIRNMPATQTSSLGVFLYSIPANFLQVAKEDAIATAGAIGGAIVDSFPVTLPILFVVGALLLLFYGPRPKGFHG